jgi:3-oxoacyl-[acyl-carrier protein] reductase
MERKTCIVTGSSRGIGKACILAFAREGCNVVVNYMRTYPEDLVKILEENGTPFLAIKADVSKEEEAITLVKETVKTFGDISILVNNAGITKDNLILRMKAEDFKAVLDVNLTGAFNMIKASAPFMVKQKFGRIINISSVVGLRGNAGQVNYAASKAGLIGLTKSLAKELARRNITVNAVAPGYIRTDMTEVLSDTVKDDIRASIPAMRLGNPEDIADAVIFLSGDKASYITGQVLAVDGGMSM